MATIQIKTPDGKTLELNAPEGATPDQINQAAQSAVAHYKQTAPQQTPTSALDKVRQLVSQGKPIRAGYEALTVPEDLSKQGLGQITNAGVNLQNSLASKTGLPLGTEPTGNLPADIMRNIPRIAGETLTETAPGFISRGSILTAGVLKGIQAAAPLGKLALRGLAGSAESITNSPPGMLEAAYNDSSLLLGKGKKAVQSTYEAAKGGEKVSEELSSIPGKMDFVQSAGKLADEGKLNPTEALAARKELDAIKRTVTKEFYQTTRDKLDKIAKTAFEGADAEYKRAIYSEGLRKLAPQNKYGGASPFRLAMAEGLRSLGVPTAPIAAIFSPAVAGTAATGTGIAARNVISPAVNNPGVAVVAQQLIKALKKRKSDNPILNSMVLGKNR